MKNNWKTTTIGDLISVKRGYDLTSKDRIVGNIPVYGAAGQNGFHNESKVNGPGIVIGRSGGSFGQVHYVEHESFWPHNTAMYVTDFNGNDVDFVFYLLKNLDFSALNSGSAQPSLNRNYLYPVKVKAPHLDEQILIGQLLSSLDNKIELNNKINAELEAMAKLIYDYWFVQFDFPDANGKPYKSSGGKMVYNEELKREIPEGWTIKKLKDLSSRIGDGIHGTPQYVGESEFSFINGNNLKNGFIHINSETKKVNAEQYKKHFIKLDGNSILISINGTLGNLAVFTDEKVMLGKSSAYINCHREHRAFCYQYLKQKHVQNNFWNIATGSTIKNLSLESLKNLKLSYPQAGLIFEFNKLIRPIDEKRENIFKENKKLFELRDWLLPMLMNSQVTISKI